MFSIVKKISPKQQSFSRDIKKDKVKWNSKKEIYEWQYFILGKKKKTQAVVCEKSKKNGISVSLCLKQPFGTQKTSVSDMFRKKKRDSGKKEQEKLEWP